jgi:hypothetical protein
MDDSKFACKLVSLGRSSCVMFGDKLFCLGESADSFDSPSAPKSSTRWNSDMRGGEGSLSGGRDV